MKLIHLSDLHLGKRVNEYSMLEDQEYILLKILEIIDNEKPDGVMIAGDVYDKSVPSAEAVQLFDDFLNRLAKRKLQVFVISGNHDSAERIAFGARLMDISGIHMSRVYEGKTEPYTLEDEHGKVNIYMLPFIKPAAVRRFFEDRELKSYTDAIAAAIEKMNVDTTERNVIITHQFVTGSARSDSEEISVGGTDNVDSYVFDDFDYVALGHIHGPQNCGKDTIRYCGTPLKYSFSEVSHKKSVTVVELGKKGDIDIRTVELTPKRDMRDIRGTFDEITAKENYEGTATDDYVRITLTDEMEIPNALSKLRRIYPNIMILCYDNRRTRNTNRPSVSETNVKRSPEVLFADFYKSKHGYDMSDEQSKFINELIREIWEADNI